MTAPTLDVARSTLTVEGRTFPACCVRCPRHESEPDPWDPADAVLGGDAKVSWEAYVPTESGLLISVEVEHTTDTVTLRMDSRTCYVSYTFRVIEQHDIWLPYSLGVTGAGAISERAWSEWRGCESWWLVEQIDRLAAMPYVEPPGPCVELLPLREVFT